MRPLFQFYFFFLFFLVLGCKENDNKQGKPFIKSEDSVNLSNRIDVMLCYPKRDSLFSYDVKLKTINDYSLTIQTVLIYDSIFLRNDYYRGGNQVVLNQSLIFKHKDSVISIKPFPIKGVEAFEKFIHNKKEFLPQYVVTNLQYKELPTKALYILYAFGLSNGSNEISAYYSQTGELLCTTNYTRKKCETIGNLKKVENEYVVYDSTKLKEICIFPPAFAGKNDLE
jgi:hypothetical protein